MQRGSWPGGEVAVSRAPRAAALAFEALYAYMSLTRFRRHGSDRPVRRLLGFPDFKNV